MSDLINRQDAIDAINHICPIDTEYDCTLLDRMDVRYVLSELPSAERKRGKWIPHETQVPWGDGTTDVTMFRCSVCGYEQDWQSKFCPNCGADTRERKEE